MKTNPVARNYRSLTPEERFRLILAASGRGDETERDRLVNAGDRIGLAVRDHVPYALAFQELGTLTFLELLEMAALYSDAQQLADEALRIAGAGEKEQDGEEDDADQEQAPAEETSAADSGKPPAWTRALEHAYAAGFILRTKADGWKLFCERLNVPPFLLWVALPGFDRLQRALARAEKAAFAPEGFLRWLNAVRPAGKPQLTEVPPIAERTAEATARTFRSRAEWWGS
jgi:hypothetical protein